MLVAYLICLIICMIVMGGYIKHLQIPEKKPPVPTQIIDKTHKVIFTENRYFKYFILKNNQWVLHNLNGPAIFDEEGIIRPRFYINGIECKTELQYLVEKENYKNGNINKNTI